MGLVRRPSQQGAAPRDRRAYSRDVDGLLRQVRSGDAEGRRRAALDLWGEPGAVPGLLEAWAAEPDGAAREAMLVTLAGHDRPVVGRALAADLRREEASLRNAAVRALQSMPVAVEAVITGLLTDPDPDVRVLAVMVLSAVPHPDVPGWLRPVVEDDTDENVVAAAVDVALTLGGGYASELADRAAERFPGNPYLAFLRTAARP